MMGEVVRNTRGRMDVDLLVAIRGKIQRVHESSWN
jgi:hypothetical protein